MQATKEINSLISKIVRNNKDPNRMLSILDTPKGPFIAWTECDNVSADDDEVTIREALALK
jgi:hypothetical protein